MSTCRKCAGPLEGVEENLSELCDECRSRDDLPEEEDEPLQAVLDLFGHRTMLETGVSMISGGFARAGMVSFDKNWIYINLQWGVKSDCEDNQHSENWKLRRKLLQDEPDIEAIVKNITEDY
jgi:hypothetical protein